MASAYHSPSSQPHQPAYQAETVNNIAQSCDNAARGKHRWRETNIVKAFKNYRRASVHRLQQFRWHCKLFALFTAGCKISKAESQRHGEGLAEIELPHFFTEHQFRLFLQTHVSHDAHSGYREQKEGTSEAVKALELPAHIIELWRTDLETQYENQQPIPLIYDPFDAPGERVARFRRSLLLRWVHSCLLEFDTGSFAADIVDDHQELQQNLMEETGELDLWRHVLHTRKMMASVSGTFLGITMRKSCDTLLGCMYELAQGWREVISKRLIQQADVAKTAQQVQAASKRKAPSKTGAATAIAAAVPVAVPKTGAATSIAAAVPAADSAMKNSVVFPGFERLRKLVAAQRELVAEPFLQLVQARSACVAFVSKSVLML